MGNKSDKAIPFRTKSSAKESIIKRSNGLYFDTISTYICDEIIMKNEETLKKLINVFQIMLYTGAVSNFGQ